MAHSYGELEPLRLDVAQLDEDPFDVSVIRQHCRVDSDVCDDDLLLTYMRAAILWAEGETHRSIISRAHRWVLRCFPYNEYDEICLPRGKTQSVDSIQYTTNGSVVTLTGPSSVPAGMNYLEDLTGDDGGVIMPPITGSWPPSDLNVPAPVVINFTAGWTAETVPSDLLHALMFYVSDAYEMRGTADIDKGRYYDIRCQRVSAYALHRWY